MWALLPKGREITQVFLAPLLSPSTGAFLPLHVTPGPDGSLPGLVYSKAPKGVMPRLGVWAGRVEGRVVSSPSEAVSGPQSRESEASEAAKPHRHSHSRMRMHTNACARIPANTRAHRYTPRQCTHTRTHTLPSRASQRARLHGAGTQSNMWKLPPPPQGALQGPERLFLCRLAFGHSEGSTRLPQPSRAPSPPQAAPPALSGADSSSPRPTAPSGSSPEHRCRHQAGHHDFTSPRQADQLPLGPLPEMFSPACVSVSVLFGSRG